MALTEHGHHIPGTKENEPAEKIKKCVGVYRCRKCIQDAFEYYGSDENYEFVKKLMEDRLDADSAKLLGWDKPVDVAHVDAIRLANQGDNIWVAYLGFPIFPEKMYKMEYFGRLGVLQVRELRFTDGAV